MRDLTKKDHLKKCVVTIGGEHCDAMVYYEPELNRYYFFQNKRFGNIPHGMSRDDVNGYGFAGSWTVMRGTYKDMKDNEVTLQCIADSPSLPVPKVGDVYVKKNPHLHQ